MQYITYSSRNSDRSKYVFWSQEDLTAFRKTTIYLGTNVLDPTSNVVSTRSESIAMAKALIEKYSGNLQETPALMTPFLSGEKNLYFLFGDGSMKITYADGTEQIISNQYSSESWVDYSDVWQYHKDCYFELYGDVDLLHIELPGYTTKSEYSIKVASVKSDDGSTKVLTKDISKAENDIFVYSPAFQFNAKNFNEYDMPKGLFKAFKDQSALTLKTGNHASIVYLEKL